MKKGSNKRGRGTKNGKSRKQSRPNKDEGRRRFLQVMGGAAVAGATGLDAIITSAFGASTFTAGGPMQEVHGADISAAVSTSNHPEHFPAIKESLARSGLTVQVEAMARSFQLTSQVTGKPTTVTIVPFHPEDKSKHIVGAVGVSAGSPPSGVSVELDGTDIVSITTHDVFMGKTVTRTFKPSDLQGDLHGLVEKDLPRDATTQGNITVDTAQGLAEQAFRGFLDEEQKQGIYTAQQARAFLMTVPTMKQIADLQYQRHKGVTMSPGNACCSCCTCCWGCCSCTSAASSSYLSDKYRSRSRDFRLSA